jgi:hypothetical protein
MSAAREERASDVIQKVECPLKPGFEYILRSMDRQGSDWYLSVIKDRKNPITPQLYVDWSYM